MTAWLFVGGLIVVAIVYIFASKLDDIVKGLKEIRILLAQRKP